MDSSKNTATLRKGVKVTPGVALGIIMIGFLFLNNLLIVQRDLFLGLLTLINLALLTWIIFSLRKGIRAVVRANFVEDSIPYKWFNRNGRECKNICVNGILSNIEEGYQNANIRQTHRSAA